VSVGACAFRPDGKQIATVDGRACRILDAETGRVVRSTSLPAPGSGVVWSPDGTALAIPSRDFKIFIWDAATGIGKATLCFVAVSPDGQWLATGTNGETGVQVWRLPDAMQVAGLRIHGPVPVGFSPDGKWLMTADPPCRLWAVGTWREARRVGGLGVCFSPDGRLLVVQDATGVPRLVEVQTGRTLAHLDSPDLCHVSGAFSPDGSRLVVGTNDGPAAHVWDLRLIRRRLVEMGRDWDAPAFSDDDPASSALPPLPALEVDYGPSPRTGHADPEFYEPLIADLEAELARHPDQRQASGMLAQYCNNYAWQLVTAPAATGNSERARSLSRRAVELAPAQGVYVNTLGVAQYRAGR
jgi:WD40 repeat protein